MTDHSLMASRPACANCLYLSDGFRCQRITSDHYSRKIPNEKASMCGEWTAHWAWTPKRKISAEAAE